MRLTIVWVLFIMSSSLFLSLFRLLVQSSDNPPRSLTSLCYVHKWHHIISGWQSPAKLIPYLGVSGIISCLNQCGPMKLSVIPLMFSLVQVVHYLLVQHSKSELYIWTFEGWLMWLKKSNFKYLLCFDNISLYINLFFSFYWGIFDIW